MTLAGNAFVSAQSLADTLLLLENERQALVQERMNTVAATALLTAQMSLTSAAYLDLIRSGAKGRVTYAIPDAYNQAFTDPAALSTLVITDASKAQIAGYLEVGFNWLTNGGIQVPGTVSTGNIAVRQCNFGTNLFVKYRSVAGVYLAMWRGNNGFEFGGNFDASGLLSFGVVPPLAGEAMTELAYQNTGLLEYRVWLAGTPRPVAATLSQQLTAPQVAALPASGSVYLGSITPNAQLRTLSLTTDAGAFSYDFSQFAPGALPVGWAISSGGSASVRGLALEVTANHDVAAAYGTVASPRSGNEGPRTFLMGAGGGEECVYLNAQPAQNGVVLYRQGTTIKLGYITNGVFNVVETLDQPQNTDYYVQVTIGHTADNHIVGVLRVWTVAQTIAQAAVVGSVFPAAANYFEGATYFGRIGSSTVPARYLATSMEVAPIWRQAAMTMHWIERYERGFSAAYTNDQGAELAFKTPLGCTAVTVSCPFPPANTLQPVLSIVIDGAAETLVTLTDDGWSGQNVVINLPNPLVHTISIVANGIHENDDSWRGGAGWMVSGITANAGGAVIPWNYGQYLNGGCGDSIFVAIVANGHASSGQPSTPAQSAARQAWGRLATNRLGGRWSGVGHGGTGPSVTGSGGYPATPDWLFNPMQGRSLVGEPIPMLWTYDLGTNDSSRGTTTADFQAALLRTARLVAARYPSVLHDFKVPWDGVYLAQVQAVAAQIGGTFWDDTGVLDTAVDYVDSVHIAKASEPKAATAYAGHLVAAYGAGRFA